MLCPVWVYILSRGLEHLNIQRKIKSQAVSQTSACCQMFVNIPTHWVHGWHLGSRWLSVKLLGSHGVQSSWGLGPHFLTRRFPTNTHRFYSYRSHNHPFFHPFLRNVTDSNTQHETQHRRVYINRQINCVHIGQPAGNCQKQYHSSRF